VIVRTQKMWISRGLVLALSLMIVGLLASQDARSGAVDTLAQKVCYKVHGADAQSIRKFEQDGLFRVLRELNDDVEKKLEIAEQKSKDYDAQLSTVEKCMLEVAELENIHRYNDIIRVSAKRIPDIGIRIADKEAEYRDEKDPDKKQGLRTDIDKLEADLVSMTSAAKEALQTTYGSEIKARFGNIGFYQDRYEPDDEFDWVEIYAGTLEIEQAILSSLPGANSALMQARENAVPVLESYAAALEELNASISILSVMERVVSETEACRADAKSTAPRRDFVANFKVSCRVPEFDKPACMHGSMWINFDAQGRATGQSGITRLCATNTALRQCVAVPEFQVTGATGQVAGNNMTATVTYVESSNAPRKDTGSFRFEGRVTPDGNIMPIGWRGSGSLTITENKYPLPPAKPYVITCSGPWATESKPACWDE